ncbi:MAG: helix-turn-helix domain-containing protein [Deltaproteobacteria bacterium]|nr:helix-turn-helix domain-containing protein [Deltaproteobacteria bacterium]
MSNHIHLLISPMVGNLSDAMRDLFARYATKFNRKYERKGHLFSGPYRQAVCFDDTYLLAASLYIHMNPVRAGLSESAMKYRWSSCRLYCDPEAPESFVDTGLILRLLADQDEESKKIYLEMLNRSTNLEMNHVLEHENAIARFSSKLTALFPTVFKGAAKRRLVSGHTGLKLQSLEDLEAQIEAIRNANPNRNPVSRNAKKFLIEQLIARGFYKTEIAKRLGISRKTVYNILNSSC